MGVCFLLAILSAVPGPRRGSKSMYLSMMNWWKQLCRYIEPLSHLGTGKMGS